MSIGLLLLAVLLAAGFLVCSLDPLMHRKMHWYEGQQLYLESALWGVVCMAMTAVFIYLPSVEYYALEFASYISRPMDNWVGGDYAKQLPFVVVVSCLMLCSAVIVSIGLLVLRLLQFTRYRLSGDSKELKLGFTSFIGLQVLNDRPLDGLLFVLMSSKGNRLAMLTLNSGKVYVCRVLSLGEMSETGGLEHSVSIMPAMSGYRSRDNFNVVFDTFYEEMYETGGNELKPYNEDIIVLAIKKEEIISATEFYLDKYMNLVGKKLLRRQHGDEPNLA